MTGKKVQIGLVLSMMLCLVTMMVGSCKDDNITPHGQGDNQEGEAIALNSFTCERENIISSDGLGTAFNKDMKIVWEKGDTLVVFAENDGKTDSAWFAATGGLGTKSATFISKKTLEGKRFTFVYNKGNSRGIQLDTFGIVRGIRIPSVQSAVKKSFDPQAVPMIGKVKSNTVTSSWNVKMYPVCAYAAVNCDANWSWIELSTTDKKLPLCTSNLKVDYSGDNIVLTPNDTCTSITLNKVEAFDSCYIAVLPGKVGKSLNVRLCLVPEKDPITLEQTQLDALFEFKRNYFTRKLNFSNIWQDMDGTPLMTQIVRVQKNDGTIQEFFTKNEVKEYMEAHKDYKMLNYSDFMNESRQFYYTNELHWDEKNASDYILWNNVRHYFPLKGYYDEKDSLCSDSIVSRTWCLNFNGDTAYYQFDKTKNVKYSKEYNDTVKYNLRLKKVLND